MKFKKPTKAAKTIPRNLVINNGVISMVDGSSSEEYLKGWQKCYGIPNGTPIAIMTSDNTQRLLEDLWAQEHLTLSA